MDDAKEREHCERAALEALHGDQGNGVLQHFITVALIRERADAFEAGRKAGREESRSLLIELTQACAGALDAVGQWNAAGWLQYGETRDLPRLHQVWGKAVKALGL